MSEIVLSDELLKIYYDFKNGSYRGSNNKLTRLLLYYREHHTNVEQLKRVGIDDGGLEQTLSGSGHVSGSVEELCWETKYKLILDLKKSDYPYLNIMKDEIEATYTATYKNTSRKKTIEHIKALCRDAKFIFIYGKYISGNNSLLRNIAGLLPDNVTIINGKIKGKQNGQSDIQQWSQSDIDYLKRLKPNLKIRQDTKQTYSGFHDRYLLIDNKMEIILTSGFDHLFSDSGDFTCIIRPVV
jgi:hypothetical protein